MLTEKYKLYNFVFAKKYILFFVFCFIIVLQLCSYATFLFYPLFHISYVAIKTKQTPPNIFTEQMETEYGDGTIQLDYVSASNQRHSKSFQIKQRSTWADVRKFVIDEFSIAGNVFLTDMNGMDVTVKDLDTTTRGVWRCILVQSEDRNGKTSTVHVMSSCT